MPKLIVANKVGTRAISGTVWPVFLSIQDCSSHIEIVSDCAQIHNVIEKYATVEQAKEEYAKMLAKSSFKPKYYK